MRKFDFDSSKYHKSAPFIASDLIIIYYSTCLRGFFIQLPFTTINFVQITWIDSSSKMIILPENNFIFFTMHAVKLWCYFVSFQVQRKVEMLLYQSFQMKSVKMVAMLLLILSQNSNPTDSDTGFLHQENSFQKMCLMKIQNNDIQ